MKVKFGGKWYDVLKTKESCGLTWYAIEDEPNHIDWINNPEDIVIVMDYEQKYKEALEKARQLCAYPTSKPFIGDLQDIFPELNKSEDEKIRKSIINLVKWVQEQQCHTDHSDDGIKWSTMIAWLEKQGEQKPVNDTDEDIVEVIKNTSILDMVEPKFKVGDWVVQGCNILKIRCAGKEYYCYETVEGHIAHIPVYGIDSLYHLWTIEDAEDGDILCSYEWGTPKFIFILRGTSKEGRALSYYCYQDVMYPNCDFSSDEGHLMCSKECVYPATKEQRELLFVKMRESGYEWDAKKKELKKK